MLTKIRNFATDQSGATAIEYGLIAALISIAGISALQMFGDSVSEVFVTANTEIDNALQ